MIPPVHSPFLTNSARSALLMSTHALPNWSYNAVASVTSSQDLLHASSRLNVMVTASPESCHTTWAEDVDVSKSSPNRTCSFDVSSCWANSLRNPLAISTEKYHTRVKQCCVVLCCVVLCCVVLCCVVLCCVVLCCVVLCCVVLCCVVLCCVVLCCVVLCCVVLCCVV